MSSDIAKHPVVKRRDKPFGQPRLGIAGAPTDFGFTGQRGLAGAGLQDYNARWFDTSLGAFASADPLIPDPFNPQALNRYGYVLNNPLRYTDPTGMYVFEEAPTDRYVSTTNPRVRYATAAQGTRSLSGTARSNTSNLPQSPAFVPPLPSTIVTGYDYLDPRNPSHPGVDVNDTTSQTIVASSVAIVQASDPCTAADCVSQHGQRGPAYNRGYGNVLLVEYPYRTLPEIAREAAGLQPGESLFYLYAHLLDPSDLVVGQVVGPDQQIGTIGSTGNSTGPHLHLETRIGATGSFTNGHICSEGSCAGFDAWYAGSATNTGAFMHIDPLNIDYFERWEVRLYSFEGIDAIGGGQ